MAERKPRELRPVHVASAVLALSIVLSVIRQTRDIGMWMLPLAVGYLAGAVATAGVSSAEKDGSDDVG